MEVIYAIYKENIIPLVGGVNPAGIEIGLATYNNWQLCAMEENEFNKFSEFRLYPIPKAIAVGMVLLGRTINEGIQDDVMNGVPAEVMALDKALNDKEEKLALLAREYLLKLELKFITRAKIRQFKDFEDDLSDTKLLVEFLLGYISEDYSNKTENEKDLIPIRKVMDAFVSSIEGKNLRINNTKILNKISTIIKDESFISRIVKSTYVDQVKNIEVRENKNGKN